jgi:hypothetical protein
MEIKMPGKSYLTLKLEMMEQRHCIGRPMVVVVVVVVVVEGHTVDSESTSVDFYWMPHRMRRPIEISFEPPTMDRFNAVFQEEHSCVLHLSSFGHTNYLDFENGYGALYPLPMEALS